MDSWKSVKILQALADGVDPLTGATLAVDSPLQRPQVIRALYHAIQSLEKRNVVRTEPISSARHREIKERPGTEKPWTGAEEALLKQRFDEGVLIGEIARLHNRTPGSILSRLHSLGKVASLHLAEIEEQRFAGKAVLR